MAATQARGEPPDAAASARQRRGLAAPLLHEQALLLYDRGRFAEALERIGAAQEAHADYEATLPGGAGALQSAELLGNLLLLQGCCHYALRDFPEAERMYTAAREALDIADIPEHYVGRVSPLVNLGLLHFRQGELRAAMDYYREAQRLVERHYCTDRMAVADLYHNIAVVYDTQDQLPKALEYYKKALRIRERFEDTREQQLLLALTKENIAMIWRDQDNTGEAIKMMHSVLPIRKRHNGPESPEYASSLFNLGLLHFDLARVHSALAYFKRCADLRRKLLGADSPPTVVADRYVAELEARWNRAVLSSPGAYSVLPCSAPSAGPGGCWASSPRGSAAAHSGAGWPGGGGSTAATTPRGAAHADHSAVSDATGPPVTLGQLRSPSPGRRAASPHPAAAPRPRSLSPRRGASEAPAAAGRTAAAPRVAVRQGDGARSVPASRFMLPPESTQHAGPFEYRPS